MYIIRIITNKKMGKNYRKKDTFCRNSDTFCRNHGTYARIYGTYARIYGTYAMFVKIRTKQSEPHFQKKAQKTRITVETVKLQV